MQIQTAALILSALHIGAALFLIRVLTLQIPLLNAPDRQGVRYLRFVLFSLALALLISNIIPIIIDIATVFGADIRSAKVLSPTSMFYTFNNGIGALVAAAAFWYVYRTAGATNIRLQNDNDSLTTENDRLHKL